MIDYKGFWQDFTIAEKWGISAIQDTYNRAQEWRTNAEYITALVITLNHKIWYWYDKFDSSFKQGIQDAKAQEYSMLYDKLWRELDEWCMDNLKGSDLTYYIQTTD